MSICLRHRRRRIYANSVPVFRTFLIKYLLFLQVSSASQAKNIFPNDAKFFTVILEHLTFHSGTKNLPIFFHVIDTLIQALLALSKIQTNITAKLFTQYLFCSTANTVNSLALDQLGGYGCIKQTFSQKGGRKTGP